MNEFADMELEARLSGAIHRVENNPKNSLGWLLAAYAFNASMIELKEAGAQLQFKLPTNCTLDSDEEGFYIEIPAYDMSQQLRKLN